MRQNSKNILINTKLRVWQIRVPIRSLFRKISRRDPSHGRRREPHGRDCDKRLCNVMAHLRWTFIATLYVYIYIYICRYIYIFLPESKEEITLQLSDLNPVPTQQIRVPIRSLFRKTNRRDPAHGRRREPHGRDCEIYHRIFLVSLSSKILHPNKNGTLTKFAQ